MKSRRNRETVLPDAALQNLYQVEINAGGMLSLSGNFAFDDSNGLSLLRKLAALTPIQPFSSETT